MSEPSVSIDAVLEAIPEKVTEEMNEALCREYTNDEIRTALFQMGPTKALGPDGFPTFFLSKTLGPTGRRHMCCCKRIYYGP